MVRTSMLEISGSLATISVPQRLGFLEVAGGVFDGVNARIDAVVDEGVDLLAGQLAALSSASAESEFTRLSRCSAESTTATTVTSATISRIRRTRSDMELFRQRPDRLARRIPSAC